MVTQTEDLAIHATHWIAGRVVTLLLDPTRTRAFLRVRIVEPQPLPDADALVDYVRGTGIAVSDDSAARIRDLQGDVEALLVAEGCEPVAGRDGEIRWIVTPTHRREAQKEQQVDFRQVMEFVNVKAGQSLCVMIPPELGTPGRDVFGGEIPASPGDRPMLRMGTGVHFAGDGATVVARTDGSLSYSESTISVENVFQVAGDVDYSVGNIDFAGQVEIRGNVLAGFVVRSTGDIVVFGNVAAATLEAGGDVTIFGGVSGQQTGLIRAGGSVRARYLNQVSVEADGDVLVTVEVVNSTVVAGGRVELEHGRIIGGLVTAGEDIRTGILGSPQGVPSHVIAGIDATSAKKVEKLSRQLDEILSEAAKIDRLVGPMLQDASQVVLLPVDKRETMRRLALQAGERRLRADQIRGEIAKLTAKPGGEAPKHTISVSHKIYSNVEVQIGAGYYRTFTDERPGPVKLRASPEMGAVEAV